MARKWPKVKIQPAPILRKIGENVEKFLKISHVILINILHAVVVRIRVLVFMKRLFHR